MKTTASLDGTPQLASLRKVIHIVGDHHMGIKGVPTLLTIAIVIV